MQETEPDAAEVKREIKAHYDGEADDRDALEWIERGSSPRVPESKSSHYFIERKVDEAIKYCDIDRGLRVLEIGCSFGHMTALLAARFDHVVAVDISPRSIDVARKRLEYYGIGNVTFIVDDAEELTHLGDNSFDVVFSFSTIRYCPHPEKALSQVYAKLDANGVAIIDFPNKYSPWHWLIKNVWMIRRHAHDTLYSGREIVSLFERAGLRDVETKYFLFTTKRLPDVMLPLFRLLDRLLERIPFVRSLAGIIMARGSKR